jgi:hypothetical protein
VRLRIRVARGVSAPRVAVEFRDANGGLLGASETAAEELGWNPAAGEQEVRFEVSRLPLSDGLFRLSVALSDPSSTRQYHRLDPAAEFTVFPDEIFQAPRSWVQHDYPTLRYYNKPDRGGHFAAWEEPGLFTNELRAAFRSLR